MPISWNLPDDTPAPSVFESFRQWVDIGERPRHYPPLMWISYSDAPFTVAEAYQKALANKVLLMHRHEEDRVVAQAWIPSKVALVGE